ncbi:hypothetical protein JCM33374_g5765 [Metschnikowia sp. JCM 33374]|nr:hypothetical protein JCM33374_g5765 [Metschnikowia sp. JCM 33374]
MSQFRDRYVENTDSQRTYWNANNDQRSRDDFGITPSDSNMETPRQYSPLTDGPISQNHLNMGYPTQDFRHEHPRYTTSKSSESHELSNIQKDPFNPSQASFQPMNPFHDSTYPDVDGYTVAPTSGGALDVNRNTSPDETTSIEEHMLRNERNRKKLVAQLPKFHYTKVPWFSILVTSVQVIVFLVELIKMGILTGTPFQSKPYFNPMIGPSIYVLINMGARYVPCMHKITGITSDITLQFPCPNSTSTDTNVCSLNELCGLSGIPIIDNEFVPSQYYRIVLPIFLHAGILHILFNLILQLTMGVAVERCVGWLKYCIIYITSGVSGFLLGSNFALNGVASTGASGSLFGVMAANLLLFIYCGRKNTNIYETKRYKTFIFIMIMEILVSFVLGLLPGLDNFSHIGGFCMGLLMSIVLISDPSFVYKHGIYTYEPDTPTWKLVTENWNPLAKYKDKVPWKIAAWAVVRIASLVTAIVYFSLLTKNLKSKKMEDNEQTCSWCKYINCIPINNWCEQGQVTVTTSSIPEPTNSPTTTTAGIQTTIPGGIFNPPTTTANAKRDNLEEASIRSVSTFPKLQGSARQVMAGIQLDSGSSALVVVLALVGYSSAKKLKSKISQRKLKRKEKQN